MRAQETEAAADLCTTRGPHSFFFSSRRRHTRYIGDWSSDECSSDLYEEEILRTRPEAVVRRDYAASVLSYGEGLNKRLLINGLGMTTLTPITKVMVHLPLGLRKQRSEERRVGKGRMSELAR